MEKASLSPHRLSPLGRGQTTCSMPLSMMLSACLSGTYPQNLASIIIVDNFSLKRITGIIQGARDTRPKGRDREAGSAGQPGREATRPESKQEAATPQRWSTASAVPAGNSCTAGGKGAGESDAAGNEERRSRSGGRRRRRRAPGRMAVVWRNAEMRRPGERWETQERAGSKASFANANDGERRRRARAKPGAQFSSKGG